ncbi:DUF2975 domain-containing protein [Altererythrobacter aquiaggeris]|uniref:DUF2975 domain-containing protein n=1 Tax=Aestuarierythrobacter aquiaggeris TaxID=1898396 RepID=UPI003019253D
MTTFAKDPLLAAARIILYFILGVIAFAAFFVTLGAAAMLLYNAGLLADIQDPDIPRSMGWQVALLLLAVTGVLYLGWRFMKHMLDIVTSVSDGDPFVPANADRLTAMAWLMLAINLLALPIGGFGIYLAKKLGEHTGTAEVSMDFGGLTLILTLFILARVFRHGTSMRDDLEGTV